MLNTGGDLRWSFSNGKQLGFVLYRHLVLNALMYVSNQLHLYSSCCVVLNTRGDIRWSFSNGKQFGYVLCRHFVLHALMYDSNQLHVYSNVTYSISFRALSG